jgi:flagellin
MRVQHNIAAMNSYRNYNNNTKAINKNLEKLSSGYKVNRAGDDAAGLAISEKMRAQITGLEGAQKNAKDGISLVQTAEGALTEVHSMLNRMYSLAEQSANGTYDNGTDRAQLQKEVTQLSKEIDRIADSSNFNGIKLLDGSLGMKVSLDDTAVKTNGVKAINVEGNSDLASATGLTFSFDGSAVTIAGQPSAVTWTAVSGNSDTFSAKSGGVLAYKATISDKTALTAQEFERFDGAVFSFTIGGPKADGSFDNSSNVAMTVSAGSLTLQIGDTADKFNQLDVNLQDVHVKALGIDTINIASQNGAQTAMDSIKQAINTVSSVRGTLGASQNRLEHTINNLSVMQENIQDAESTIRDTDVADEMMKYTKNSILVQSAQAMLAQANQQPQGVLQLLQ